VWRSGEGPPLVLVHGAAADHSRWAPVLPELEAHFTVLALDRRGRGQSGDADEYALEREFEDVVAVVEAAGSDVNVLGHSHGGSARSRLPASPTRSASSSYTRRQWGS
jgi:pimeloyl-ACP methyl ester carboxylesterase